MTEAEQIERQAETIKALWVKNTALEKRCAIQQFIIDKAEQEKPPTWKEQIMQEARRVFGDG